MLLLYTAAGQRALHELPEPLSPLLRRSARSKRSFWGMLLRRWGGFDPDEQAPRGSFGRYWRHRHGLLQNRGASIEPIEPPPSHIDRILASLHAAAIAQSRAPGIRPPEPWPVENYPPELEKKMERKEPQFFLRNIPRAERFLEDEEYDRIQTMDRDWIDELTRARSPRYEPPELLEEMNLERVTTYRRDVRKLLCHTEWSRYFCRELKEDLSVAIWRYDPDAPKESDGDR